MRKFYRVVKPGAINNLQLANDTLPEVAAGKVLVEVKSIGLNYADLFAIMGLYSATPKEPFTPGLEYAGVVAKSDSSAFNVGARVIGVTRFGAYTSQLWADPDYLMSLPEAWTFAEGAAFPVQTLTAYYALKTLGDLRKGQVVLIHSAAGGVGLQANRIARKLGAHTIGVVGNAAKLSLLEAEGFERGIVRGPKFEKELAESLRGRELNLVLETTGGKYFKYSYKALAPMGRVVSYGSAQFTPSGSRPNYFTLLLKYLLRPRIDPLTMITQNKSVLAFNLIWLYEKKELMKQLLDEIDVLNLPPPMIGHEFDFADMKKALAIFKEGHTTGKVVINLPE